MRFVGERKACAATVLALYAWIFAINAIAGPPAFKPVFAALGAAYGVGFFGVVAGWFWARWYSLGLAFSGLLMAVTLAWKIGIDPTVLFWGGTHALLALSLVGGGPQSAFDGRKDWRERFRMDDSAANRLGKAVMRAGAGLPYLILAGLAPREGGLVAAVGLALAAAGLWGLTRLRAWGVLALAGAAAVTAAAGPGLAPAGAAGPLLVTPAAAPIAALLLAAAVAPFALPVVRFLRGR